MDIEHIKSVDSQNMRERLEAFPAQWQNALELTSRLDLSIEKDRIDKICFVGMGGSAMGAEIMKSYLYESSPYPMEVVRHYNIPAWVDEKTLVIATSYSGNTEETLSALRSAQERGAQPVAITGGGDLMLKAAKEEFDYVKLPGSMPTRLALGYLFVPLYRIFQSIGLIDDDGNILEETKSFLEEHGELFASHDDNEALHLAEELNDTLPIFYSDSISMKPVNMRWQSQFEENAKTLAYGNFMPEMTHNEIVGWERVVHLTGRLSVVMLEDESDNSRVKRRMEIVEELVQDQAATLHVLKSRGPNRLARMFSLIQLADWTSYYLAVMNGIDPTPVTKIDLLKSKLSEA